MNHKPFAAAAERNSQPILDVIREEFGGLTSVLEVGSGTGQHAVRFAAELAHVTWQTSDVAENHAGVKAWLRDAGLPNIRNPLALDVLTDKVPADTYDGVFSANTAHIMSLAAVEKMFSTVSAVLPEAGVFVLYGPFRIGGNFNSPSNAQFHRSLREQDATMGVRHLEDLDRLAEAGEMQRVRLYAMPANNQLVVWKKVNKRHPT
ncbi:MAG: class I SAM-dependent methyltransferase [Gammaproteobacteria bacterium]|nr:class I SAM-dependent methyltransferase [Gammaproteobacteria bacterium]MDH3430619.1 class I SAM-dependent methyltransferase [Gammaproteobacteria bacterium]